MQEIFTAYAAVVFLLFSTFSMWTFFNADKRKDVLKTLPAPAKFLYVYGLLVLAISILASSLFILYHLGVLILSLEF